MRPVIIAHRGASGHLPEHTLAAKALAYAMGADYLEQDIVATRDDELVVLHDIFLDRVTDVAEHFPTRVRADGRFYVRDFDLAELEIFRVHERTDVDGDPVYATRFRSAGEEFRVNTFARELELVAEFCEKGPRPVGIYPEIKNPAWHRSEGVDITLLMLDVLKRFGYTGHGDPIYLQCFDEHELRRIRHDLDSKLKLVQLIGEDDWSPEPTNFAAMRSQRGMQKLARTVDAIGPWVNRTYRYRARDGRINSSGLVERAHTAGLAVHPYTFRRDELPPGFTSFDDLIRYSARDLLVDGLFTDFPGDVLKLFRRIL
jgi:glycerophosphoryl diester phosphodiesterase